MGLNVREEKTQLELVSEQKTSDISGIRRCRSHLNGRWVVLFALGLCTLSMNESRHQYHCSDFGGKEICRTLFKILVGDARTRIVSACDDFWWWKHMLVW